MKTFTKATCPCKSIDWATLEQELLQVFSDAGPVIDDIINLFGNLTTPTTCTATAAKLHDAVK